MLERIPSGLGHALRGVRAGYDKVVSEADDFVHIPDTVALESPAFDDGGSIPPRYTADGDRISPPLSWARVPRDAGRLLGSVRRRRPSGPRDDLRHGAAAPRPAARPE